MACKRDKFSLFSNYQKLCYIVLVEVFKSKPHSSTVIPILKESRKVNWIIMLVVLTQKLVLISYLIPIKIVYCKSKTVAGVVMWVIPHSKTLIYNTCI
jgi:hypothetical protein